MTTLIFVAIWLVAMLCVIAAIRRKQRPVVRRDTIAAIARDMRRAIETEHLEIRTRIRFTDILARLENCQ